MFQLHGSDTEKGGGTIVDDTDRLCPHSSDLSDIVYRSLRSRRGSILSSGFGQVSRAWQLNCH